MIDINNTDDMAADLMTLCQKAHNDAIAEFGDDYQGRPKQKGAASAAVGRAIKTYLADLDDDLQAIRELLATSKQLSALVAATKNS